MLEGREAAWRMAPYDSGWKFADRRVVCEIDDGAGTPVTPSADLGPLTIVMTLVALVSAQDLGTHGRMGWLDGDFPVP